jgi:HlyD family secretion protein
VLIILLIFTAVIRYPDSVYSSVRVDAEKPVYHITSHCSGIIDTILISESEVAITGQPIILFKNTMSFNDYLTIKCVVEVLRKRTSLPAFKNTYGNINFDFGGEIKDEMDAVFSILNEYDLFLQDRSVNLEIEEKYREAECIKNTLGLKRRHKDLKSEESELARDRYRKDSMLFKKGVISENALKISKQQFLGIQQQNFSLLEEISQLEKESFSLASKARILETRHETERKLYQSRIGVAVNELSSALEQWESKYLITAQTSGEIILRNNLFAGKHFTQGDHLASIIPSGNRHNIAVLAVSGNGRGKIKTGQKVIITLDAYPPIDFGTVITSVDYISEIPVNDEYIIYASLPDTIITSFDKTILLSTELLGTAEIITESHSILQRIRNKIRLKSRYL